MSLNVDDYGVIDVDTHIIEPPDLWTSRVSVEKWGDAVPHVVADPQSGVDLWVTGSTVLQPAAIASRAHCSPINCGTCRHKPSRRYRYEPTFYRRASFDVAARR